ncbi:PREDICTED: mediator of RNA polymerase II transcription subunit 13-like [Priapulus caudatus]|uniref:Mediator of RNA polymerase II transcription subunit 13-like n=1 Tax=Priapulus caudatus TaxID=37621 RepID=A0ABM1F1A5_PRICU|nr:PREDICTED: mediator of RNA polymerase II transcription subunit 13-like [Priapulus caudatus]
MWFQPSTPGQHGGSRGGPGSVGPGSVGPASVDDGSMKHLNKQPRSNGTCGLELTRMFPTPPSLDSNHMVHSPCCPAETTSLEAGEPAVCERATTALGSPQYEAIKDWSYVYRPPTAHRFVSASKYAPLTALPSHASQREQPIAALPEYKPSWQQYPAPLMKKHMPV